MNLGQSLADIFKRLYLGENGVFFVSLAIQAAFISTATQLINTADLSDSYWSPWLAHFRRKVFQNQEPWLRKENNTFQFGLNYAYLTTFFSICILYSATVPLLSVACMVYALIRHAVDALNMITVFRKEIDSQGRLITTVTNTVVLTLLLYQVSFIAFLVLNQRHMESKVCVVVFVLTLVFLFAFHTDVTKPGSFEKQIEQKNLLKDNKQLQKELNQWR